MSLVDTIVIIGLATGVLLGLSLLLQSLQMRRKRSREAREEEAKHPQAQEEPLPDMPPTADITRASIETMRNSVKTASKFRCRLRELLAGGMTLADAFSRTLEEFKDDLDESDGLAVVADMGYAAEASAAILKARGYSAKDAARTLEEHYDMSEDVLGEALLEFVPDGNPRERAEHLFAAIKSARDQAEPEEFAEHFAKLGCSPAQTLRFCIDKGETDYGELCAELRKSIELDLPAIARAFREAEIDLTDSDNYCSLRDGGLKFEEAAELLGACGSGVAAILECENGYSSDEILESAKILVQNAFPVSEVLTAVLDMEDGPDNADIVDFAAGFETGFAAIGSLFAKYDIDAEDLDTELRARGYDLRDRIQLLHAMLFPPPDQAAPADGMSANVSAAPDPSAP